MRDVAASGLRRLGVLPIVLAVLAAFSVTADRAQARPVSKHVEALGAKKPIVLKAEGAAVILTSVKRPWTDEDTGEKDEIDAVDVSVALPGLAPFTLPEDEWRNDAHGEWISIGRLSKTGPVAAIVEGYSGGAHCCATFQVVTAIDGKAVTLTLPPQDGEPGGRFPRDIDKDGTVDFARQDDSFRYAFASGAGSWSPPRIWNLRGAAMVDVSAEPRFARVWQDYARVTLKACKSDKYERNGACAAYAAALTRLGRAEEGIVTASKLADTDLMFLPESCTVAYIDDVCPEGQEITFTAFEPALRWFLDRNGYTR
jgi:hypothetical protein